MCPACLTTAALAIAGVTSAGGLTTLVVQKVRARRINSTTLEKAHRALAQSSYPKLLFAGNPGALVSPAFAASFARG